MRNEPERWQRVVDTYESVIDVDGDEREARLAAACAGDDELRREVESLIAQEARQSPLDNPVWVADNLLVPALSLEIGAPVGPYIVEGVLGTGGMGEVYRARDSKLGRSVALKILPDTYVRNQERRARFQREARILASLNHPHIGAIHGFEDSGPVHALVLELVEGSTLADRLSTGPLPVDEATAIALQIVDALDAAHDQGVVHRDLKPANIKIRPDGAVKVLDFGLARLAQPDGVAAVDAIASPTITSPAMTGAGVILGTAGYMSPEQAKGRTADARSDVWAFGCVFYEMLTGKRPFDAEDVADTLAAVLRAEPDFSALPASTPLAIRRLLEHCLRKDRRRRLAAIADVRLELEDAKAPDTPPRRDASWWRGWAFAAAAALLVTSAAVLLRGRPGPAAAPDQVRFTIPAPDKETFAPRPPVDGTGVATQVTISPDGRHVVFVAGANGQVHLWLRLLDGLAATAIPDTDGASFPFWSPDSQQIAFFAHDKLKSVPLSGGPARELCDAPSARGGTWSRDNMLLFSASVGNSGLLRVPAQGGVPVRVTTSSPDTFHRWPHFLPDGAHFLYTVTSGLCCPAPKPGVVMIGSLDPDEPPVSLMQAESSAFYAGGYLFFARADTFHLMAQRFAPESRRLSGDAFPVAENVSFEGSRYVGASASDSLTVVYGHERDQDVPEQLTWFDRQGRPARPSAELGRHEGISVSPDGARLAVSLFERPGDASEVWLRDLRSGNLSKVTSNPGFDRSPVWSPDGTQLAYVSERGGTISLRQMSSQGTDDRELFAADNLLYVSSWSPDGRFLAFTRQGLYGFPDVWALPLSGNGKPVPVVATSSSDSSAVFSPDTKWVAFTSGQVGTLTTGRLNVFVQRFREGGEKHLVSSNGAGLPFWSADGRELFYLAASSRLESALMSVPIESVNPFKPGTLRELFRVQTGDVRRDSSMGLGRLHAVTGDGRRFLISVSPPASPAINVIVNWRAAAEP